MRSTVVALTLYVLFVVYASLLPWRFAQPGEPLGSVPGSASMRSTSGISRGDFVANVLLFVPLGFLAAATLFETSADRRWIGAAIRITFAAALLSAAIEYVQLFIPARIFTPTDVAAETLGAMIGLGIWTVYGPELASWLDTWRRPATRTRQIVLGVLAIYAAAFVMSHVAPLNLTADVSILAQKYRQGDIVFVPFTSHLGLTALAACALMAAPIGALIACSAEWRLPVLFSWICSVAALGVLELLQVPIIGQRADSTEIVAGAVGALLGIVFTRPFVPRPHSSRRWTRDDTRRQLAWATAVIWVVVIAAEQWWPLRFRQDYEFLRLRLSSLASAPFETMYLEPVSLVVSQLLWKFCLGVPFGLLLTAAWPMSSGHRFARLRSGIVLIAAIAVFGVIELGQLFLPARHPNPIDVVIEVAGVMTGMYAASAMGRTVLEFR